MAISDLKSIFSNGWFDDNDEVTDSVSVGSGGWFEKTEQPQDPEDYRNFSSLPNRYFQEENVEYNRESELFDLLITEAFNMHGVPMVYYVNTYDTNRDKLFGEDNDRDIERFFNVQTYYDLPEEQEIWSSFGIEGMDNFHILISMRHFNTASTFDQYGNPNVHSSYIPKEGDYIKAKYNEYYYEVVTVKKQTNQFHKKVHIWDLIVKPMRDEHLTVSAAISFDPINHVQAIADIFNTSAAIEAEKPIRLYQPGPGEQTQDPLFGSW